MTIACAVGVSFFIRNYFIEAYRIPTPAMSPTLIPGDTVFVSKWAFQQKTLPRLQRGEVVVFSVQKTPSDPEMQYVRRVVGIAGDQVEVRNGVLKLNNETLSTDSHEKLSNIHKTDSHLISLGKSHQMQFPLTKVPEGSVFVMGDLRGNTPEFPYWQIQSKKNIKSMGLIPISSITAKALWTWLSLENSDSVENLLHFPKIRWNRMFRRIE